MNNRMKNAAEFLKHLFGFRHVRKNNEAASLEPFLALLDKFCLQIHAVLSKNACTPSRATLILQNIIRIRQLLSDLETIEKQESTNAHVIRSISELQRKYLDMEGMVKEKRNAMLSNVR